MVNLKRFIPVFFLILNLIHGFVLYGDAVDSILLKVDEAVQDESYTRAIAIIEEGKKAYPDDYRLPMQAGELYMGRELYHLALAEFKAAEVLNPYSGELLYDMAESYGYLGRDNDAVNLLERLYAMDIPDLKDDVIDDLSWMYFKTYRMDDGIDLLETVLKDDFSRNWAHTLGTLYAGLYNLEQSRYWYMKSIDDALNSGDELFASVAYYNLSLLDYSFYLYGNARDEAMRSLEIRPRSGGFMIIGELDFLAWNLNDAIASYRKAESRDDTPLSRVDIASFYQRIGYLDEAIRFVQEIQNDPDDSWMYHYGVNRMRFSMDLHLILADSWKGKAHLEAYRIKAGFLQRFFSVVRRLFWRLKGMYHDRIFRSLTLRYSGELRDEGNELDAAWNAAKASRGYRRGALAYLEEARLIETELTPRAVPWYEMEMGREAGDENLLMNALSDFTDDEGDPYERTLRALAGNSGSSANSGAYLQELYTLNPGGLRQYGLSLPVVVNVSGENRRVLSRRIRRLLKGSGYRIQRSAASVLTVSTGDSGKVKFYLGGPDGSTLSKKTLEEGFTMERLALALSGMFDRFYFTPLSEGEK